jgi:phospholipase D-like protein/putative oligomerization/nucleic acid binding protein
VAFFVFVASDYPFLDVFWTMIIFFLWVIWIWFLIAILSDVFRRHDIGGGKKALWCFFIIFLPVVGALTYLIVNGQGMAQRNVSESQAQRAQMDEYVRSVASSSGGAAGEIEKAKQLLDSGAISADEYASLKAKALAGGAA